MIGGLAGAGITGLIGLASGDDEPGWLAFSAEEKAAMLGILAGPGEQTARRQRRPASST